MEGIIHVYDVPCLPVNASFQIQSNDSYQVHNNIADDGLTAQRNDLQLQANESYPIHSSANAVTSSSLRLQSNRSYQLSELTNNFVLEQNQSYQVHSVSLSDQGEINSTTLMQRKFSVQDHDCPDALQNTQLSNLQFQSNESYQVSTTLDAEHNKQNLMTDVQAQENESYQVQSSAEWDTGQKNLKLQSSDNFLAHDTQDSSERKQSLHLQLHNESLQVDSAEDKTKLQTNECYHTYSTAAECKLTDVKGDLQLQKNECYGDLKVQTDKCSSVPCSSTVTNRDKQKGCKCEYQLQLNESYQQRTEYQLQLNKSYQQDTGSGQRSGSNMKTMYTLLQNNTDITLKSIKKCLIFLSLCIVLLLLSTIAAIALSLFTLSQQLSIPRRSLISNNLGSDNNISLNTSLVQHDPAITPFIAAQLATVNYNLTKIIIQLDEVVGDVTSVQTTYLNNFTVLFNQIEAVKDDIISMQTRIQTELHCGPGFWDRVAHVNMSDPQEECPSAWREYVSNNVRVCGRPISITGSCPAVIYSTSRQYNRVCGRIIGYQFANPDAFSRYANNITGVDGVTVTYGAQRHHIWSFAAGLTEGSRLHTVSSCPCTTTYPGTAPPQHIGNNYHCESGNPYLTAADNHPYFDDPLWDGQQCEGTCCTDKDPPWFSVQLPNPTTDMIEVRICADGSTSNEDTPIGLLEIYLQ